MPTSSPFLFLICCLFFSLAVTDGAQLILVNNCRESIWPGILGGAGHPTPQDGGFQLNSGEEVVIDLPENWSGRIWGRQGCCFDNTGKGTCDTGDCSGLLHCRGTGGTPPSTVVEMTLGSSTSPLHFYDVSLVDGFNLPVSMKPVGGGIGCGVASCEVDLNVCCPSALEVKRGGKVVGCKSACLAMKSAKYCCTGEYANPKTCKPTIFAHLFKAICPKAYSYAFDDSSSLNKCRASRNQVLGISPHSDTSTITILTQDDDLYGLQIQHEGEWVPVKPIPNALVVNVGDVIEIWSNGKYKSIEHRAVPNEDRARLSFASFVCPHVDVEIEPFDCMVNDHQPLYKKVRYGDYLRSSIKRRLEAKAHIEMAKNEI